MVEFCLEFVSGSCDFSAKFLQLSNIRVNILDKSPKIDVISGAAFNIVLELNKFIGEFKIFIYLGCFADFFFINFLHLFLNSLQVVYFLHSVKHACTTILFYLGYRINSLHFIFNSVVIE